MPVHHRVSGGVPFFVGKKYRINIVIRPIKYILQPLHTVGLSNTALEATDKKIMLYFLRLSVTNGKLIFY